MIEVALWLFAAQGVLGAFDTLYFHEWRARLPALPDAWPELVVHAVRDFVYAVMFASLPWLAWRGAFAALLAVLIVAEIALTFTDFVIERRVRKGLGDVYPGERVTHGAMAIVYGAALANLAPTLFAWWKTPTAFAVHDVAVPFWLRLVLTAMGIGVALSGLRDLYAALGLPGGSWPWGHRSTMAPRGGFAPASPEDCTTVTPPSGAPSGVNGMGSSHSRPTSPGGWSGAATPRSGEPC